MPTKEQLDMLRGRFRRLVGGTIDPEGPSDPRGDSATGFYPQNRPLFEGSLSSVTKYKQAITDPEIAERYADVYSTVVRTMWQDGQNDRLLPELLFLYFDYLAQELTDSHSDSNFNFQRSYEEALLYHYDFTKQLNLVQSKLDRAYTEDVRHNALNEQYLSLIYERLSSMIDRVTSRMDMIHNDSIEQKNRLDEIISILDTDAPEPPAPPVPVPVVVMESDFSGQLEWSNYRFTSSLTVTIFSLTSTVDGVRVDTIVSSTSSFYSFSLVPRYMSNTGYQVNMLGTPDVEIPLEEDFELTFTQTDSGSELVIPCSIRYVVPSPKRVRLEFVYSGTGVNPGFNSGIVVYKNAAGQDLTAELVYLSPTAFGVIMEDVVPGPVSGTLAIRGDHYHLYSYPPVTSGVAITLVSIQNVGSPQAPLVEFSFDIDSITYASSVAYGTIDVSVEFNHY